jgi:hypothetical protein
MYVYIDIYIYKTVKLPQDYDFKKRENKAIEKINEPNLNMASSTPSSSHKYVTNADSSSSTVTTASKLSTKPRYFGNVTLEMIDDFLKPLDGKPSQPKIKFLPVSLLCLSMHWSICLLYVV